MEAVTRWRYWWQPEGLRKSEDVNGEAVNYTDHLRVTQRLTDLVRYARHYLHEENLISDEEFAALVADSENGNRVARLELYDKTRKQL